MARIPDETMEYVRETLRYLRSAELRDEGWHVVEQSLKELADGLRKQEPGAVDSALSRIERIGSRRVLPLPSETNDARNRMTPMAVPEHINYLIQHVDEQLSRILTSLRSSPNTLQDG